MVGADRTTPCLVRESRLPRRFLITIQFVEPLSLEALSIFCRHNIWLYTEGEEISKVSLSIFAVRIDRGAGPAASRNIWRQYQQFRSM